MYCWCFSCIKMLNIEVDLTCHAQYCLLKSVSWYIKVYTICLNVLQYHLQLKLNFLSAEIFSQKICNSHHLLYYDAQLLIFFVCQLHSLHHNHFCLISLFLFIKIRIWWWKLWIKFKICLIHHWFKNVLCQMINKFKDSLIRNNHQNKVRK